MLSLMNTQECINAVVHCGVDLIPFFILCVLVDGFQYGCSRMPDTFYGVFIRYSFRQHQRSIKVPLRYNYDKPEKPRRIKGFEVFSLVFSSFSKPKNHTEISRIIGGVSLTTNEQQKGTQSLLISNTVEYWIQAKPSLVSSGGFCHFQDCCAGT